MLNNVYRLVAPRTFEPVQVQIDPWAGEGPDAPDAPSAPGATADAPDASTSTPITTAPEPLVLVRPTHLSICVADMRYYLGRRSAEALAKKLPMALIHEGVGQVVFDPTGTFEQGQQVVMLPNNAHEQDPCIGENYLPSSQFCGSGYDGFLQEIVPLKLQRIVPLPQGINLNVAAFTELVSVAMHAISRFDAIAHERRQRIGVWGDGNLGFIVALLLHTLYPESRILVFGRNEYKLNDFTFADETHLTTDIPADPARIPASLRVDHAFECCGGDGAEAAIDQIIDAINPEGTISLLGVSENPPAINTRMVLEKGLRVFGSSRSDRESFVDTIRLYEQHPQVPEYLASLVGQVVPVQSVADIARAFELNTQKPLGKTIIEWNM